MVWSNWQGATWRGALVVVLIWSGLAWTQTPGQRPGDPADRIMVVHENGRKIRCRVEESWQLPDGRVAHLLQALDSGEKITIVDDPAAVLDPTGKNSKAMPKRIFAWGVGRKTPPEGSPIPPHLRSDSGIVINQDALPRGAQIADTSKPANPQVLDFPKAAMPEPKVAQSTGTPAPSGLQIVQGTAPNEKNTPQIILMSDGLPPLPIPSAPDNAPSVAAVPTIEVGQAAALPSAPGLPAAPTVSAMPVQAAPGVSPSTCCEDPTAQRPWRPGERVVDWLQNRNGPTVVTVVNPAPPIPGAVAQPITSSSVVTGTTGPIVNDPRIIQDSATEKKPWRPGDRIVNWFSGKAPASPGNGETVKATDTAKVDSVPPLPKSPDGFKVQKIDDYLAQNDKAPEKKAPEKFVKAPTGPFSTAMGGVPDAKNTEAAAAPTGPVAEKKDMWGVGAPDSVLPPGKSVMDGTNVGKVPPVAQTRVNDPLTMPERFADKRSMAGAIPGGDIMPGDPSLGGAYPLGSQSVLAARSGMVGQITYVPVPTVTVPQPFNPPTPPEPKLPSPPELNAYVNAFTPPPQPKGTQEYPAQGIMPAQAMNPMMQQQMAMQQYMMQQQMMQQQQQMMQQQAMNPYGYHPNTYPPTVSQGPATNFTRQYQGPQAPNPVGTGPVMPASYAPTPYAPMMPQQQPMQQVGYQQPNPAVPQVDQLIKVLRESPYPAQREWAAQYLTSFEWRVHPHIVPSLLQSASHDPAASVRAGCVFCLGRMQAAVEPVFSTLNSMRNDIDPRVRQEVQQTLIRLGQTPTAGSGN